MKQIEYVVRRVSLQRDLTLFLDPIEKTSPQNSAKEIVNLQSIESRVLTLVNVDGSSLVSGRV